MKDWLDKSKHWFKRLFKKEEKPTQVAEEPSITIRENSIITMPAEGMMGTVHPMSVYQHRIKVAAFRLTKKRPVFITKAQRYKRRKAEHLRLRRDYLRKVYKQYGRVA